MKASKCSDAQKAFILKQGADGIPVAEIWWGCSGLVRDANAKPPDPI